MPKALKNSDYNSIIHDGYIWDYVKCTKSIQMYDAITSKWSSNFDR